MTDANQKHTVSIWFVRAALEHVPEEGRDRALAAAGIPGHLVDSLQARVPADAYSALWLAVARELDDEFFGLDSRRMKVGSFALIAQAALSCPNVDRALRRMLRAFGLFLDDIRGEVSLENGEAVVRLTNGIADASDRRFAEETLLTLLHGLMCWLAGRRIPLTRVCFEHPRPPYAREYMLMYCDDVTFDAPRTSMHFDARALPAPVVQTPLTLQSFLQTAPQSVFLKYRNEDSWSAKLRLRLRASVGEPATWPVFEDLAVELGTTPTTLRRRLEREGTSYQTIKDALRNDVAIDALCSSTLSVDEIAARIGFQDASAFHRAFKRWNGLQPGEYRRQQQDGTEMQSRTQAA